MYIYKVWETVLGEDEELDMHSVIEHKWNSLSETPGKGPQ